MKFLYTYSKRSRSAKELSRELGYAMVREPIPYHVEDTVINWGCYRVPSYCEEYQVNSNSAVAIARNKLSSFVAINAAGGRTVPFSINKKDSEDLFDKCGVLYKRTLLTSSRGRGIFIIEDKGLIEDDVLYTGYIVGREYRIHIGDSEVIHKQEKRKRSGIVSNKYVKNYGNGYVFCIQDVHPNEDTIKQSILAVKALGLDFGAVDIIEDSEGKGYVLEVNTAPALEGTTLKKYVEFFKNRE